MDILIIIFWPLSVLVALYAGFRFGARAKTTVIDLIDKSADAAKGKIKEI